MRLKQMDGGPLLALTADAENSATRSSITTKIFIFTNLSHFKEIIGGPVIDYSSVMFAQLSKVTCFKTKAST